jgi:hypothetical protein
MLTNIVTQPFELNYHFLNDELTLKMIILLLIRKIKGPPAVTRVVHA